MVSPRPSTPKRYGKMILQLRESCCTTCTLTMLSTHQENTLNYLLLKHLNFYSCLEMQQTMLNKIFFIKSPYL